MKRLIKTLHSKATRLTRRLPYREIVAISKPTNRGVIMSELRRKIYSKRRMMMANVIAGMATGRVIALHTPSISEGHS